MSEDNSAAVTMDKKVFVPPAPKTTSDISSVNNNKAPTYKQQDAINFALPSRRGPRRRSESTASLASNRSNSSNGQPRADSAVRRNPPQKEKKGRGGGNQTGEQLNFRDARFGPEIGSLQAPGAKKRGWYNIFHFTPRQRQARDFGGPAIRGRNDSGGRCKSNYSPKNFLLANCKFFVKTGIDYAPFLTNPDLLVDWECIEQIVATMIGEGTSCPICLGTPVAAKMTRCGHIFCWSCSLHYLALSDNESRPCPICYEPICTGDLKSVVANVHYDVEVGDVEDMELIRRQKDMMSVTPLYSHESTQEWHALYSKVLIMSPSDVLEKVVNREHRELAQHLNEDPDCPEAMFIHQAIFNLMDRKKILEEAVNDVTVHENDVMMCNGEKSIAATAVRAMVELTEDEREGFYYFYQDAKGLNVFLHPLNFSMLIKEFGSEMASWPRYLAFRVIDKEYHSVTEETRKRWKFLKHLALSTPFVIVEVDIEDFVSPATMEEFSAQIEYRKNRREQRVKEEKKMAKMIAERERKLWNIAVVPIFEPVLDFPEFRVSQTLPEISTVLELETPPPTTDNSMLCSTVPTSSSDKSACCSASFAQMASRAAAPMIKKSPSFPVGGSTAPCTPRLRRQSDSEPEGDDYVAIPEFRTSMSDAITKALENVVLEEPQTAGQRKKRKGKGKVLFATGGMGSFN